jgi:Fur family ferric uptake transcriptional regulator
MATAQRRVTPQQQVVARALEDQHGFVSAQSLHLELRSSGAKVGLATVYRALAGMVDAGTADVVQTAGGESLYRLCGPAHHHHLLCRDCGATVEIVSPAVERWAAKVAAENGYTEVEHTVQMVGVCTDCRKRRPGG